MLIETNLKYKIIIAKSIFWIILLLGIFLIQIGNEITKMLGFSMISYIILDFLNKMIDWVEKRIRKSDVKTREIVTYILYLCIGLNLIFLLIMLILKEFFVFLYLYFFI